MEYTGNYKTLYSVECGEVVSILEYKCKTKKGIPYMFCSKCNKPIKRTMYVVQSEKTDIELMYLGSDCVKHLK